MKKQFGRNSSTIGGYLNLNESFEQTFGDKLVNLNEETIANYLDPNNPNSKENYEDLLEKVGRVVTFDRFMMITNKVISLIIKENVADDIFPRERPSRPSYGDFNSKSGGRGSRSDFFERFSKVLPFLNKGEYADLKVFLFVEVGNFFVEEFANLKD